MDTLSHLSELLRQRNAIDALISSVVGRPATTGHLGEFIASKIFGIELMESATHKGIDGHFSSGTLAGCSVNVKFYPKQEEILDIPPEALPDYFLVLTGPHAPATSSRGKTRPFVIQYVYLFHTAALLSGLKLSGVKVGVATSVKQPLWAQAEIFPSRTNRKLTLTDNQRKMLALFSLEVASTTF